MDRIKHPTASHIEVSRWCNESKKFDENNFPVYAILENENEPNKHFRIKGCYNNGECLTLRLEEI